MKYENNVDSIIDNLIKSGANISNMKELRDKSLEIAKKDLDIKDVFSTIAVDIQNNTEEFLNNKNSNEVNYISGISSCIYMPDFNNNGEFKLKLIGGTKSRNCDLKIDQNTTFDIASITKMFTLLLLFKLEEMNIIDLNSKICDVNPDFQNLEDFTLNDLIRLHGELRTDGNVAQAQSKEEAYRILKTIYLSSNNREENKYTDFGAIVLGDTLEKVVSKKLGRDMNLSQIMEELLLTPLKLSNTHFNPAGNNISGNGNGLGLVHDPKSRILGGAVGSAGLFTTSDDLARLSKNLFSLNYINKNHAIKLGEITFPNSKQNNKGNLGIYVKHPLGFDKTFTPSEFSTGSFSHQGWTGTVATFDPNNMIHQNILVNAIYENENKDLVKNDKPSGYGDAFAEYLKQITKNTMLMYVAKKYYNKYYNEKESINETRIIK